jgi:AcrR family transcriptional regulator
MAWRGYDNVRASELARVTRMSVGTLYRHYGSKRGFALAVRAFTEQELCRYVHGAFLWERHRSSSLRDGFLVLWKELTYFAMRQPALFSFTFLHWHPEDLREAKCGAQVRAMLHEVLSEGEREGALASGASQVGGALIWGALAELVRARTHGVEVRDETLPASGEALWRALAAREGSNPRGGGLPSDEAGTGEPASGDGMTSAWAAAPPCSPAPESPRGLLANHDSEADAGMGRPDVLENVAEVVAGAQPLPRDGATRCSRCPPDRAGSPPRCRAGPELAGRRPHGPGCRSSPRRGRAPGRPGGKRRVMPGAFEDTEISASMHRGPTGKNPHEARLTAFRAALSADSV